MSSKGSCASCLHFDVDKIVKSKESLKPTWLSKHDYTRNFIEGHSLTLQRPTTFNVEMKMELGKRFAGKKLLYWAANGKKSKSLVIEDARKAYGRFENSGVVKTTSDGKVVLRFDCPQLYKAKRGDITQPTTFFRHVHFVVEKDGEWDRQIYTKVVICNYTLNTFIDEIKSGTTFIINAIPTEYSATDYVQNSHKMLIPNAYNVFHKTIAKMSVKELHDWFGQVIKINYPKLATQLKNKKLDLYEIPIVTYCAHEKCNASELVIKELMKKGFVNINEYGGAIMEYRKMIPVDR